MEQFLLDASEANSYKIIQALCWTVGPFQK
jgi:hypothetical protein